MMILSPTSNPAPALLARNSALMQSLAHELQLPEPRLQDFIRLQDDLFLDDTDVELLVATLERRLNYFLTEEEMAGIETIGDIQRVFLR